MNIKGKVHEIGATQQVSETFKKRDLIVEYAENPTYPEFIKLEFMQDKTSLADNLKVGEEVDLEFNLRGRPWTDKVGKTSYFNSLVVWKINSIAGGVSPEYALQPDLKNNAGEDDDLPF